MKIIELHAENFMRLVAVTIRPDGNLVQITGKNGNGKSSVLNAIWAALAGKSACPTEPVRKGSERALLRLNLGDITVTRTFTKMKLEDGSPGETTTKLTVEKSDGARYPSPQVMLDALVDSLGFDPLEFANMKPADQFDALRRFMPDFDFDEYDNLRRGDFAKRTDFNRIEREKRAAAEAIALPAEMPVGVDEDAIVTLIAEAGSVNLEIEKRRLRREQAASEVTEAEIDATNCENDCAHLRGAMNERMSNLAAEVSRIEAEAKRQILAATNAAEAACDNLRGSIEAKTAEAKMIRELAAQKKQQLEAAEPLPDPVDVAALQLKLAAGKKANAVLADFSRRGSLVAEAAQAHEQAVHLTARIEARDKEKEAKIAAAKMPVPGLSFGERCVLLNGLPFSQASDRERLVVSASIAMAANPDLKVLRIRQGSQLDSEGLAILEDLLKERDYQAWIERVDETGKVGFVLEDGHLKEPEQGSLV